MENSVKALRCLCIDKIVDTYKIDINFSDINELNNAVCAFQKFGPSLLEQKFFKTFKEKDAYFGKLLWFFYYFIWNVSVKSSLITDYDATILTNWVRKNCNILGEVRFVGCDYQMEIYVLD